MAFVFVRLLVANTEAGARGKHACGNVHGEKFLEEKFGGIGDVDLRNTRLVVARTTFVFALLELTVTLLAIGKSGQECFRNLRDRAHQATDVADVDCVRIRYCEKTFLQECGSTMSNHAITFHFTETQSTIPSTTFDRLARENL